MPAVLTAQGRQQNSDFCAKRARGLEELRPCVPFADFDHCRNQGSGRWDRFYDIGDELILLIIVLTTFASFSSGPAATARVSPSEGWYESVGPSVENNGLRNASYLRPRPTEVL